jgi:hypothetical protein
MLAPGRKRPLPLLITLAFILVFYLYRRDADRIYVEWASSIEALPEKLPANRTLGFGAVVVVSKTGSDRRYSLEQAANVTDIDLTIPKQPRWTEGDLTNFRNGQENDIQRGSLLAWMGHRHALQWYRDPVTQAHRRAVD